MLVEKHNIVENDTHSSEFRTVVETRSETIQEIVSTKPGVLVRWGNIIFLLLLILLVLACWLIPYPETILTTAKLNSINSPKPVINLLEGKLVRLDITEGQMVDKDEILGYLESTANHQEVLNLETKLDSMQQYLVDEEIGKLQKLFSENYYLLGELQSGYQTFAIATINFNNYLKDGFYEKKRKMLLQDLSNIQALRQQLLEQKLLQGQDVELALKTFQVNEDLKKENVLSDLDMRIEKSKLIARKLTLPQINASILINEGQQIEKQKEIIELDNSFGQQRLIFQQSLNTFQSQVDQWKKQYLLLASTKGRVTFDSFIQVFQQLHTNQVVCFINQEASEYFAEVTVPQENFGKVELEQRVVLKFESYPFQEYGSIVGKIDFISRIPGKDGYLAKVAFTDGLVTTRKKEIQFRQGLNASAEIVVRDSRLLERFYYNFLKQLNID